MSINFIKNKCPILLGIAAILLYGVKSSASSSLENDVTQQKLLMERVNSLEFKLDKLNNRLEGEIEMRQNLQALNSELVMQIDQLVTENIEQNQRFDRLESEFETKIDLLTTQRAQQEEEIQLLKNKPASIRKNSMPIESDSSPRLPPSSCRQLSTIGHSLDGIYLVANQDTKKIEAIYCEFGSSTLSETFYGSVDVKSKSVHFTVQRTNSEFALENVVIPFDIERLNVGGAMNLAAGVFTAPVDGIYHFEFKGVKYANSTVLYIYLQVNGVDTGRAYATNLPNFLGLSGISASLKLKNGDQVRLFKTTGTLHDNQQYTYFSGWLVEEDLVLG